MNESKVRQLIRARRARFVAAAIAGAGLGATVDGCCPQPCLTSEDPSNIPPEEPDDGTNPAVCLYAPVARPTASSSR